VAWSTCFLASGVPGVPHPRHTSRACTKSKGTAPDKRARPHLTMYYGPPFAALRGLVTLALVFLCLNTASAQTPPSTAEIAVYEGLHAAAASGDVGEIDRLVKQGA